MNSNRTMVLLLVVFLICATMVGCAAPTVQPAAPTGQPSEPAQKYQLKASCGDNDDYPSTIALKKFAELVQEKSKGQITIDVFTAGSLYGDQREEAEAVRNGTIAFSVPQISVLSSWEPKMDFFTMFYLFKNEEHAVKVLDSDVGKEIFGSLESSGFEVLAPFAGGGMRSFYNSKKPIVEPSDIKGMKLRTTNSPLSNDAFAALGAIPTPIAWSELYTTLMQKGADGAEHAPTDVLISNLFEPCKYYSLDKHTYELMPIITGKAFMDSLPSDLQKIIRDCAKEALIYNRQVAKEQGDTAIAKLKEKGMLINDNVNKQAFIDIVAPVNEKYADKLGRDIYDKIVEMGK